MYTNMLPSYATYSFTKMSLTLRLHIINFIKYSVLIPMLYTYTIILFRKNAFQWNAIMFYLVSIVLKLYFDTFINDDRIYEMPFKMMMMIFIFNLFPLEKRGLVRMKCNYIRWFCCFTLLILFFFLPISIACMFKVNFKI
jgi:hypothetical protein